MIRRVLLASWVGALVLGGCGGGNVAPYEALRQQSVESIPGAIGYALAPPPEDAAPTIGPADAKARYPARGAEVSIALATIRDSLEGTLYGPAWVLFARGVCLRNAKGELVSAARGGQGAEALRCTDATIWVLAVDVDSGDPIVALTGYDETETWGPDVSADETT